MTKLRVAFIIVTSVILAGAVSLLCYAFLIQKESSSLLRDLRALNVGRSTSADAEQFVEDHHKFFESKNCEQSKCQYNFAIQNRWLAALHLEPSAQFYAGITVENGMVTRFGASLIRSMDIYPTFQGSAGMAQKYVELPEHFAQLGHYGSPTPIGKPYLEMVLDSHADPSQQQRAFAFSFRCLTKLGGGCDLPCDYLPLAWQDWKTQLQTGGFPMSDFDQAYPNNKRCQ